uniref:Uncharacterized protein n=1 Tax=Sinocyclocheilus anshuiensis TaxID=1608454 RepID=A0A671PTR4_9TELE
MAAIATVPNYTPSLWVRLCHAIPRLDLTLQTRNSMFTPDSWEYQQVTLSLILAQFSLPSPCFSPSETIFTPDSWWWVCSSFGATLSIFSPLCAPSHFV